MIISTSSHITRGRAILYARKQGNEKARLHFLKELETGDVLGPLANYNGYEAYLKPLGNAAITPTTDGEPAFTQDAFHAAVDSLIARLEEEKSLIRERQRHQTEMLLETTQKYERAVARAGGLDESRVDNEDALVGAVKAIGKYLGAHIVVPTLDVLETASSYLDTMLRLSGIQGRPVTLKDNWYRRHSGAMLCYLEDGSPMALLPIGISGYRLYDPVSCTSRPLTKELAQSLSPNALSLLRTFPNEKIGFKQLLKFIFGENIYFEIGIILLFSFLASLVAILPPLISKQIFDEIVPGHHAGLLIEVIVVLLAFQLASIGFNVLTNLSFSRIKMKVDMSLQGAVWQRLLKQNISFFHRSTTGEMISRIKGLSTLNQTLSLPLLQSIPAMLFSFVNIAVLYRYCATITPTVLWMFAGLFAVTFLFNRSLYRTGLALSEKKDYALSMNMQFVDSMTRIKTAFAQDAVYRIISKNNADIRSLQTRVNFLQNALEAFYTFFGFASVAVVYLLIAGTPNVDIGDFVAYIAAFLTFEGVMLSFMRTLNILPKLMISLKNVAPILSTVSDAHGDKAIPKHLDGSFEFRHVYFTYDQSAHPVLSDLDLRVEKGQSLGVVGVSGCGKSTLLKLLLGLYTPSSGHVLLGGYDLATVDLPLMRSQIGVAMQGAELPVGSLYSAITENDPSLDEQKVFAALEKVGIAEEVCNMPQGLYTPLENAAATLSHGQRQRLSVARAIVKPRPYLFLDETTSHLDNITQAELMRTVYSLDCTKLIIAQRLATVEKCDKLLIIEEGRVRAFGSYDELINKQHLYTEVFDLDDDEDELEAGENA
jgi:ABC-type bacteriocin/lantibiotic exporters, contain an N-terminal double-glycine peptidase domain